MRVLGVSCDYHDAAAALVVDGEIVAAAEQERFSRVKHDDAEPGEAIASCLAMAGLGPDDVDVLVFHEKPLLVFNRVMAARQRRGPRALRTFVAEMPTLLKRNLLVSLRVDDILRALGGTRTPTIRYGEHHLSHAAAAFVPSPFPSAAILTIDGIGEWATASIGHGLPRGLELLTEQRFPNSLGLLYSLATTWCGFEANDGEYKLMGLAPFGEPRFAEALDSIVHVDDQGVMQVDAKLVDWWSGRALTSPRLIELLGGPPRDPEAPLTQREADLARSVQDLTERAVLAMASHAYELTGQRYLCLGGGVALNCVANARLLRDGPFDDIWVQPAAGDAGSALGAALWYSTYEAGEPAPRRADGPVVGRADAMRGAQLGPSFDADDVGRWLSDAGVEHVRLADLGERCDTVARRLADGDIVGWFEGRMEFGPRALGHRSILADPRSPTVQSDINRRVKGRESFRPFAPAVLWERADEWFELDRPMPYMTVTAQVASAHRVDVDQHPTDFVERVQQIRSDIPACTHVDGSARVQTVHEDTSPAFHALLRSFEEVTGCPVLLNTSFNRAGEPIVCTPDEALATARAAGLDLLVLEDCVIDLSASGAPA